MNFRNLGLAFFLLISIQIFAQKNTEDEPTEISTKTLAYGLTTNNFSGIIGGGVLRNSFPVSIRNNKPVYRYLAIEAVNIKNPREANILSVYGSRYVYGKRNYFFSIRPQYGREFSVFKKDGENGIGFSLVFAGGPSFGLEKPYYIKYSNKAGEAAQTVPFDPNIHKNSSNISGAGNIFQGFFKGLKVIPGLHFKAAANIDMNTFNDKVTGIEIGTLLEVFSRKPEILSTRFSSNPQVFPTLYFTLYFGNKKLVNKIDKLNGKIDKINGIRERIKR
jgi:hypothetical protein